MNKIIPIILSNHNCMKLKNNKRRKAKDENSQIGGNHVTFTG